MTLQSFAERLRADLNMRVEWAEHQRRNKAANRMYDADYCQRCHGIPTTKTGWPYHPAPGRTAICLECQNDAAKETA